MAYNGIKPSLWERRIPAQRGSEITAAAGAGCHRQGDRSCPSCNLGNVQNNQTRFSAPTGGARTSPASRGGSEIRPCRCPAERPRSGCKNCKYRRSESKSGSSSGIFGFLTKKKRQCGEQKQKFDEQQQAANAQAQDGSRRRNPENHLSL